VTISLLTALHSAPAAGLRGIDVESVVQGGYDTEILADPEGTGILQDIGSSLYSLGGDLGYQHYGWIRPGDRIDARFDAGFTGFGESSLRTDRDLSARLGWRSAVGPAVLDLRGGYRGFRRPTLPVYDLDQLNGELGAACALRGAWTGVAGLRYARVAYPGRISGSDSFGPVSSDTNQIDHRIEFSLGSGFPAGAMDANMEMTWRDTRSNDSRTAYTGPVISGRLGWERRSPFTRQTTRAATLLLSWSSRRYPDYPVYETVGGNLVDTGTDRLDRSFQGSLVLEKSVSEKALLFLEGTFLHQVSNVSALAFDQGRFSAGIRLYLIENGETHSSWANRPVKKSAANESGSGKSLRRSDLSPRRVFAPNGAPCGVLFRVRAPDARAVCVVGGFNGWKDGSASLQDPDDDGIWEGIIQLPEGTWRYAFVIDGIWSRPEGAPRYEHDGFGGENGILCEPDLGGEEIGNP
jgi:hypothetical protein